jgi:four helix bundle protein
MTRVAKRYEELDAWQLADELRCEVIRLTETGRPANDFKYRNQIRDAASSAARNIAEGFGRFEPGVFAQFVEYALASTMETKDLFRDGLQRRYFTIENIERAATLIRRSLQVSRGLLRYLKNEARLKRRERGRATSKRFPRE